MNLMPVKPLHAVASACCCLQVGCGVGNTLYPLLEVNPELRIHACDFSAVAVEVLTTHALYATGAQRPVQSI